MITDADIKKMEQVFSSRKEIDNGFKRIERLFASKKEMETGFSEIIKFIGEIKEDLDNKMDRQHEDLKEIIRRHQMTLENHDSRISNLEYLNR